MLIGIIIAFAAGVVTGGLVTLNNRAWVVGLVQMAKNRLKR